ncbi:TPA: hypothetical protein DDW35_04770, partial [Candidatus Sumerlaeota bacterium]|nr:hypothetical protein [Candidatus Sumerlaeota bacterium]
VMFITTANVLDPIPGPLRDRMEILRLSGYTLREKNEIARRYLIPRSYDNTGVEKKHIRFGDESLVRIIEGYTSEAGVRNLEREIGNICRKVARNVAQGKYQNVSLRANDVEAYLGPQRYYHESASRTAYPGVSTGMAWTQTGGEILFVEATSVPGNGQLLLTGQLGDVMKESAMAGLNYLHASAEEFGIPGDAFMKRNFHLHVPAGATPKDGPSAGIAMAAAFYSLLVNQPVKEKLAMTGEITLKGTILAVGGIKEKILAAHRAGIREIILPSRCEAELKKEVPEEVRKSVHFYFVDHVVDALKIAFPGKTFGTAGEPPRPAKQERHPRHQEQPTPVVIPVEQPAAASVTPDNGPQEPPVITPAIDWDAIDETKMEAGPSHLHIESGPSRPMLRIDPEHGKKDLHHHHKPRVSPAFLEELEDAAITAAEEAANPPAIAEEEGGGTESGQEQAASKRRRGGRHRSRRDRDRSATPIKSEGEVVASAAVPVEEAPKAPATPRLVITPEVAPVERQATPTERPAFKPFVPESSREPLLVKPEVQQAEHVPQASAEEPSTDEKPATKPRRGRRPVAARRPKATASEAVAEAPIIEAIKEAVTEAAEKPAPKRRGRPAKAKVEAPAAEPSADVAEKPAPKRRGRPAKVKSEE